jgi:hypothetical protein
LVFYFEEVKLHSFANFILCVSLSDLQMFAMCVGVPNCPIGQKQVGKTKSSSEHYWFYMYFFLSIFSQFFLLSVNTGGLPRLRQLEFFYASAVCLFGFRLFLICFGSLTVISSLVFTQTVWVRPNLSGCCI